MLGWVHLKKFKKVNRTENILTNLFVALSTLVTLIKSIFAVKTVALVRTNPPTLEALAVQLDAFAVFAFATSSRHNYGIGIFKRRKCNLITVASLPTKVQYSAIGSCLGNDGFLFLLFSVGNGWKISSADWNRSKCRSCIRRLFYVFR
jgi:hypothetical protein